MPIKYEKDLLKIVNTDDINERLNLVCKLLARNSYRSILLKNRLDPDEDQITKTQGITYKANLFSNYKYRIQEDYGLVTHIYEHEKDLQFIKPYYKDLNSVNKTFEIYKNESLISICSFLIFTKEHENRNKIFSILNQLNCVKKSNHKDYNFYMNKPPILCI